MAMGSIITGTMANRRSKDAAKDAKRASADLTRRMETSSADMGAYRPEAAEARMRALRARLGIMEPLSNMTGAITGMPQADLAPLGQSPLAMKPLPSQLSTTGPGADARLAAYGIDPKDPNAQALLEQKLRGYGYNAGK
jgi:hypothetical protein